MTNLVVWDTTCATITIRWDKPLDNPQCVNDYIADVEIQGKTIQELKLSAFVRSDYELTFSGPEIVPGRDYRIDVQAENKDGQLSSKVSTTATTDFFC